MINSTNLWITYKMNITAIFTDYGRGLSKIGYVNINKLVDDYVQE